MMAQSDSTQTLSANAKKRTASRVSLERRRSRTRRHARLRKKVSGTPARPHMVVQRIDDVAGHTLASASTLEADVRELTGDKKAKAVRVGELIAARAREAGVTAVVFDRGGYVYHGRIAALADAAREGGLEF